MKKRTTVTALFLLMAATLYAVGVYCANVCEYRCVFCGLTMVSGCSSPPPPGYCDASKNHQHAFILTQRY